MSDNLGSGVSRVLAADTQQFDFVVWQKGKPPLDSELNLIGQAAAEARARILRDLVPSGFLGNGINPQDDYYTHESYSNLIFLGRQNETVVGRQTQIATGIRRTPVAIVNGWPIPLIGTRVNLGSIIKNDNDTRNLIELPFSPTTGFQTNFIFLEVWRQLVQPSSTTGKPGSSELWKYGNTEFGGTNVADQILDTTLNFPTTLRIQLQYRIRVLPNVNVLAYPDGFGDTTSVFARANLTEAQASSLTFTFTNMADLLDDQGLWRAGDGNPTNGLGTVDGYTYAVPICAIHRRNRGGYDLNNVNGSVSRVTPPLGYVEGNQSGRVLTDIELNAVGASDRPDSKYADLIGYSDILDLRHLVNPGGFDYDALLKHNLSSLFEGQLRTSSKSFSAGGTRIGTELLYTDEITGGSDNPGTTTIGAPDGVRRIFSDAMTPQDNNLTIVAPDAKDIGSPSVSFQPNSWEPQDILLIPLPASLSSGSNVSRFLPERTKIRLMSSSQPLASGKVLSAIASNATVEAGKINAGMLGSAIRITSGTGAGQIRTMTSPLIGDQVTVSPVWSTIPDSTSEFEVLECYITWNSSTDASGNLQIVISNINGQTTFNNAGPVAGLLTKDLVIEYSLLYPAGNGLSLRPDKFHETLYTNPASSVLLRETALSKRYLKTDYIQYSPVYGTETFSKIELFGTLQAASTNTATLGPLTASNGQDQICNPGHAEPPSESEVLIGSEITLICGVGSGQSRTIIDYDEITGIATVESPWLIIPNNLTQYKIEGTKNNRSYLGNEFRNTEAYYDAGSKTVLIQPWQDKSETFLFEASHFDPKIKTAGFEDYFDTANVIDLPFSLLPPLGRQDIPCLSAVQNAFPAGLNGPIFLTTGLINVNDNIVQNFGRTSETTIGSAVFEVSDSLAYEARNTSDPIVDRIGCQFSSNIFGIEFPRHYGISRIRAVFEKSDFDLQGYSATNLLRTHSDNNPLGPSLSICRKTDASIPTFSLYGDLIQGFDDEDEYVIIADVFGYDRGFLIDNGRVFARQGASITPQTTQYTFHLLLTQPLPNGSVVQISYSREPYQGNIYNSVEPFADTSPEPFNTRGLVSGTSLEQLDQPLTDPIRGSEHTLEVLAEVQFATTAGTGRFSGQRPNRPIFNVESVQPCEPHFVSLKLDDINTELAGLTTRLPLGARWRDAQFVADDFSFGARESNFVPFMGSIGPLNDILANTDNTDFTQNGVAVGSKFTLTEGKNANFNTPDQFRVTRGGSAYIRSGEKPGGPFGGTGGFGTSGHHLLYGVATLVRNHKETVSSVDKSYGGELQLVLATQVHDGGEKFFTVALNPQGIGEGSAAADRYRCKGRPIEKQRKSVAYAGVSILAEADNCYQPPSPKIRTVNPLVVDFSDQVTVSGNEFSTTVYLRESRSLSPTLIPFSEHAFELEKNKIQFSIPTYSGILASGDGQLFDIIVQNPDGQLDVREEAFLLRPAGLGGSTDKVLFFDGFEGFNLGSSPVENPQSVFQDSWVTSALTTTYHSGGPVGKGFVYHDGLIISDQTSRSPKCGHFIGLSEQNNNNVTQASFLANQTSMLSISDVTTILMNQKLMTQFDLKFETYPSTEEIQVGFFTSSGVLEKHDEALLEIFRNQVSATYVIKLGSLVEGTQVIHDTTVSLDDAFHRVALQLDNISQSYVLTFDGVQQRTGTITSTLINQSMTSFEVRMKQPIVNGSQPGVRAELFVDNILIRRLNS